jgi:PKD repeat protein
MKRIYLLLVLVGGVALACLSAWAQGVAPKGIIPVPPESQELAVQIWVDKGAYKVGEPISIHYSVNKQAYVYIWDIQPDGVVRKLFDGHVSAGEHTVPGSWMVAPPLGTEYLQILATITPVDPFSFLTPDPEAFRLEVETKILGILPVSERSWNFTSFEIVSGSIPSYGTVIIRSIPSGAWTTVDGSYRGYTPCTLYLPQGYHQIVVNKSGYQDWSSRVFVIGGRSQTITAPLELLVPSNLPPIAAFNISPTSPGIGEWIRFDASASYDPDGTITSYGWAFGDGATASGVTRYYRFPSPGTYTVILTVTDNNGATDTEVRTVQIGPTNLPPVASFTYSPPSPRLGEQILLSASSSYDPDGTIVSYLWDLDGDGFDDTSGQVTSVRYYNAGLHLVRLTVIDNVGLSSSLSQGILVSGTGGIPGSPPMGGIPGIFVWGTTTWHITVNAGSTWTTSRAYRLELRTDGTFQNVNQSTSGGVAPMGIVPSPTQQGKSLLFEGSLQTGNVDYTFTAANAESIWMSLKLDIDGDGDLDESTGFVYLRNMMVHPPAGFFFSAGVPFAVKLAGEGVVLVPSTNFYVCPSPVYEITGTKLFLGCRRINDLEGLP